MAETDLTGEFEEFRDELLRDAEVTGDPQRECFFRMYAELAAENGDCADLEYCPVLREGSRPYQVDGYAFNSDTGELHVAICDFRSDDELQNIHADDIGTIFRRVWRFLDGSVRDSLLEGLEETSPEFELIYFIQNKKNSIKRIRCVMFSNARLATRKKTVEAGSVIGADIVFNIIDFSRYVDILNSRGGVEPIELDLVELNEGILPCLEAHLDDSDYESYLVVFPGELLARVYGLYGPRLMEQNVRAFLQAKTKANRGIIQTIIEKPERFFAYNNGITATASDVKIEKDEAGMIGISRIRDLQIVNGGQTTAALLHARDRDKADLSKVFVQMKLSVVESEHIEEIVPLISRYANTQNRISEVDFFSNHPFHVEMQQISRRLAAPVAEGSLSTTRWFYERTRGQYRNEGMLRTPANRRKFEAEYPRSQVIQKTDLAKYHFTFEGGPDIVSRGAQKCFLKYADEISKKWRQSQGQFNDGFFRHVVAKAIVFRWLDKYVGTADWYTDDRGYKANIVTYTLAWLAHYLAEEEESVLDFEKIWRLQAAPDDLQYYLSELAPRIAKVVKSPPQGVVSNISEYAKSQDCWSRVKDLGISLKGDLSSFSISIEEHKEQQVRDDEEAFNTKAGPRTGKGRVFVDDKLTAIDAKPKSEITQEDRDYVKDAHKNAFAQSPVILRRIDDLREKGTENGRRFSSRLLTPEEHDELQRTERGLTSAKYFLLRRCDEALGVKRGRR